MGLQWALVSVPLEDGESISSWCAQDFEPFAVSPDPTEGGLICMFFRKEVWTEDDEPKSSARQPTTQPDGDGDS